MAAPVEPIPYDRSPFATKAEYDTYVALPSEKRLVQTLSHMMGAEVRSASPRNQSKMGGMSGVIQFLDVVLASTGESLALVLKTAAGSPLRATLGSAREALFYDAFGSSLEDANVPRCFYAHGDIATGDTTLLMQCLENAVPAGTFFGGEQPNNWGVQERLPELCAGNPPPEDVAADGFKLYARMHAAYWRDETLLSKPWLRASDWYADCGEAAWRAGQAQASGEGGGPAALMDSISWRGYR